MPGSKGSIPVQRSGEGMLENRSAEMLHAVAEDDVLWTGAPLFGDTLLAAPVQIWPESNSTRTQGGVSEHCRFAEDFYSRIIRTWPSASFVSKARMSRADCTRWSGVSRTVWKTWKTRSRALMLLRTEANYSCSKEKCWRRDSSAKRRRYPFHTNCARGSGQPFPPWGRR